MVIEKEASESKPVDVMGALKFAGIIVVGLLAIIGLAWEDILGFKDKPSVKKAASKEDEDTQADYEKEYLDEDISEDALDLHEDSITA